MRERAAKQLDQPGAPTSQPKPAPVIVLPSARDESPPVSLEGVAHTMRSPSTPGEPRPRTTWWAVLALLLVALVVAVLLLGR